MEWKEIVPLQHSSSQPRSRDENVESLIPTEQKPSESKEEYRLPSLQHVVSRRDQIHFDNEANLLLLSRVIQERNSQEQEMISKRAENFKMEHWMKEEVLSEQDMRFLPPQFKSEQIKYYRQKLLEKLFENETNPILKHIEINIKNDKRFGKEENESIRTELFRRVQTLKLTIFKKMEKKQQKLNEKGIFDEDTNHTRIRSLFKVELTKLCASISQIHREIVIEMEGRYNMEHFEVYKSYLFYNLVQSESFKYSEEGRKLRKIAGYLNQIRPDSLLPVQTPSTNFTSEVLSESEPISLRTRSNSAFDPGSKHLVLEETTVLRRVSSGNPKTRMKSNSKDVQREIALPAITESKSNKEGGNSAAKSYSGPRRILENRVSL